MRRVILGLLLACSGVPAGLAGTIHVAPCGDDRSPGHGDECGLPGGPRRTLQAGLDAAREGDTVLVAPGVYRGPGNRDLRVRRRDVRLRSTHGPERTLILAEGEARDHAAIVLTSRGGAAALVSGFTIAGFAGPRGAGGALRVEGGSPVIELCVFRGNEALGGSAAPGNPVRGDGAAVRIEAGAPRFYNCRFEHNLAGRRGGAVHVAGGRPVFSACRFESNVAGGGPDVNAPVGAGGAVFAEGGATRFLNCAFRGNEARHGDSPADTGSALAGAGDLGLFNCTVVGDGATALLVSGGRLSLTNTIAWSGEAPEVAPIRGRATVTHSNVGQTLAGPANLKQDPRFVDLRGGDLRLSGDSPCVDAGSNEALPPAIATDLDGRPRLARGPTAAGGPRVDIGAWEYGGEPRAAPTGFTDCNGNGVDDAVDLAQGTSQDCNGNSIPDECDTEVAFSEFTITTSADFARTVALADLDGDGDTDVLLGASNANLVAWSANTDGAGSFSPPTTITTEALGVQSVGVGDLDGDGDPDALVSSFDDDTVAWFANLGGGTFGGKKTITNTAGGASSAVTGDLDGDFDLDVVSASAGDDTIGWYENTTAVQTFGPRMTIWDAAQFAVSAFVADVDDDGDLDVLSASAQDNTIAWYENTTGTGTFSTQNVISVTALGARSVHANDLDGDGDTDVLSVSSNDDKVAWYENTDGAGDFGAQQLISLATNRPQSGLARDLNGDGNADVLVASALDDMVSWFPGLGGGVFGPRQTISMVADGALAVAVADVDGDGDADVASASAVDDTVAWYRNNAQDCNGNSVPDECEADCDGGTSNICDATGGADCNGNTVPDACDILDGTSDDCTADGVPDECEPDCNANATADSCDIDVGTSSDCDASGVPDECEVLLGGDCNSNLVLDVCETAVGFAPHVITAGAFDVSSLFLQDLNGDDDVDILVATQADNRVAWYENLGAGVFGSAQTISLATLDPRQVIAPDIDSDLDFDVLVGSAGDNTVSWFENLGGGVFGPRQVVSTFVNGLTSIDSPDLTFDGSTDILAASGVDDSVVWFENTTGLGNFGPPNTLTSSADGARFLYSGDLDLDGDVDEIVASFNDDTITWFDNQFPTPTFVSSVVTTGADGVTGLFLKNLNLDPYLDIVAASFNSGKITWYRNLDGTGFGPEQTIATNVIGAQYVYAGDLDGDGDTDVVSASSGDDTIAWYENLDSVGSFGQKQVITDTAFGANVVLLEDIDEDGDIDVIAASRLDNRIVWWENLSNDCNGNGVPDSCDADCNGNGIADDCDLRDGPSQDCDANGIPDECDILTADCNGNGAPDACDLAAGSPDCNHNDLPDECDIASGTSEDCELNGVPDECETDCNGNGIADSCDLGNGTSEDCGSNGIPDECEIDCNGNGLSDDCDLVDETSQDCNLNAIPDECETGCSPPANCDADSDDCQDLLDCDPADDSVWRPPGAITTLVLASSGGGQATLSWGAPLAPGAEVVRYESLRSESASSFFTGTACLPANPNLTTLQDAAIPAVSEVYFYLVRVSNDCPGAAGSMGSDSTGTPRSGQACP